MRKWYGIVRWATEDVIAAAKANGVTMTEEQAIEWWGKNEDRFVDIMKERGNELLLDILFNL